MKKQIAEVLLEMKKSKLKACHDFPMNPRINYIEAYLVESEIKALEEVIKKESLP